MKDILTAPFVQEMMQTTANMYRLGWDERNGGNISYMLDEKEVGEYLDLTKVIRTIPTGFDAKPLIGKIFIVTGTGKYFKNVQFDQKTISHHKNRRGRHDRRAALGLLRRRQIHKRAARSPDEPHGETQR